MHFSLNIHRNNNRTCEMFKVIVAVLLTKFISFTVVFGDEFQTAIFPPLPPSVLYSDNKLCQDNSELYLANLKNFTLWAHEMWDATAKAPTGLLKGHQHHLGDFDECLNVRAPFITQYCLITYKIQVPEVYRKDPYMLDFSPEENIIKRLYPGLGIQLPRNIVKLGWCVPKSCTIENLRDFLQRYADDLDLPLKQDNANYTVEISDSDCQTKEEIGNFDGADISFCLTATILVLIVLSATLYECYMTKENEKPAKQSLSQKIFLTFSLRSNFNGLNKTEESDPALLTLHGIKVISIIMVVFDHRFGLNISSTVTNFNDIEHTYREWYAALTFRGDLFVDTFFTLGGLLVTYGLLGQLEKKRINPAFVILLRYIRLTPLLAFVVYFQATLYNHIGNGPIWPSIGAQEALNCRINWWSNLLYLNTFIDVEHLCIIQTWYLACDFHYFIIAIGVCLILHKNRKLGMITLFSLILISMIIPFVIVWVYKRPGLMRFDLTFLHGPRTAIDFGLTYIKSYTRATPYFIGMVAGFIYYKLKGSNKHISRVKSWVIIFASILLIIASLVGGRIFYDPYHQYNVIEAATYAGLGRSVFSLGTVGLIYVISFGHAKIAYKFLTWTPWIPLGKLVYGVYLVHMQFQIRSVSSVKHAYEFSYFNTLLDALSDLLFSYILALVLYLMIEVPFRKIFRYLLVVPPRKEVHPTEIINNNNADSRL